MTQVVLCMHGGLLFVPCSLVHSNSYYHRLIFFSFETTSVWVSKWAGIVWHLYENEIHPIVSVPTKKDHQCKKKIRLFNLLILLADIH